jgi:hypothetical protein
VNKRVGALIILLMIFILAVLGLKMIFETNPINPWETPVIVPFSTATIQLSGTPDNKTTWWRDLATHIPPTRTPTLTPTPSKGTK